MNEQRILIARRRLQEFQRSKNEQSHKNEKDSNDLQNDKVENKTKIKMKISASESSESHPIVHHDKDNLNLIESNSSTQIEERNTDETSCMNNSDVITYNLIASDGQENVKLNKEILPQESQNISIHNASHVLSDNENIVKNSYFQNVAVNQMENLNLQLNSSNVTNSLQKENILQMANAVANVLVDEQGFDESALNNCDLVQRNQFLNCCLEEQKKLVNQLHIQISQCNNRVSELETIIKMKDAEFESTLIREVNPIKKQLNLDAVTIGILVGEKAELTATNSQCQSVIKQKTEEVIDLSGKLKNSQQRITEQKQELNCLKNNMEDLEKTYQQLQQKHEELAEKSTKLKKENDDFESETSELRQKISYQNTELANLQQELQEKIALLSLSELRMQQLTNSPQATNSLESQYHATKVYEYQLSKMNEALESVKGEKDEVSKKYQSYVQQLDQQHTKILSELEASKKVILESEIREQSYIQRLSELEQQLQNEKAKHINPVENQSEKIELLTKSIDNLVLEQENVQSLLNEKDNQIENFKKELLELQWIREQSTEAGKLAVALQSEQLGASLAVSQNQQLKTQLNEMHDAFIALSNTKLDLTEQLQAERTIGKKLNAQLNIIEKQVEELQNQLIKKEAVLIDLEKEKLQVAQIEDQVQHYQSQSYNASTVQEELQKALILIESLKKDNVFLQSKIDELQKNNPVDIHFKDKSSVESDNIEKVKVFHEQDEIKDDSNSKVLKSRSVTTSETNIACIPEAFKKLECRFKETMEKVAELTDDKQRLEHLVLQLQGETETIGEYVTLYQKQRAILQKKAKERENTFEQILEQRNRQHEQLHKLKILVAELLRAKNSHTSITVAAEVEESMLLTDIPDEKESETEVLKPEKDKTESQILDLLTEIKDCNNSCILEPNFHPCPWCSGKLITV